MLITKIQQLVVYDCGQTPILISDLTSDVKLNIYEIIQKSKDGKNSKTWKISNHNNDLVLIEPNNLYLITNKEDFSEYEFPGMVDPLIYCLSSISDDPDLQYSENFISFEKDNEELIIKLNEFYLLANNTNYLVAKAKKGHKEYNSPWEFYLDEIELTVEIPSGYYNLKPSSIQTFLYNSQQNYISVCFDLNLLKKVTITGITSCVQPLQWDCNKQSKGVLVGYCKGDCPKGYEKSNNGSVQYCEPQLDSDSDKFDIESDIGSDYDLGSDLLDSDSNSLDSDLDSDINYYDMLIDDIFKTIPDFKYYNPIIINDSDNDTDIDTDTFFDILEVDVNDSDLDSDFSNISYKESIIYILNSNLNINADYRQFLLNELERILREEGI